MMKSIQHSGIVFLLIAVATFSLSVFFAAYRPDADRIHLAIGDENYQKVGEELNAVLSNQRYSEPFSLSADVRKVVDAKNESYRAEERWDEVIYTSGRDLAASIAKASSEGPMKTHTAWFFFLTFGLGAIGALMFILPQFKTLGSPGIKNNHIYHSQATSRGWVAWLVFSWLVGFYIVLYFFPDYTTNWTLILDPVSEALSGKPASRWFVYGFLYCWAMLLMGVRMVVKYRHNRYQLVRTASVLFFQVAFAFLIPEILGRLNMPQQDFKNIWPLNYSFFFDWNINAMLDQGTLGIFMLVWGVLLVIVAVPLFVYLYGKRWYCSWVCGCGGLAETLGDPYRQHSDKSLKSWKIERWLIHGVLVFAVVMTGATLYTYFTGVQKVLFVETWQFQRAYGFLVGSVFAGVIGTGFYPIMGNRVWCRFGCPLAAYLGFVQRFKSRFRITTNGGQCISCGNCSTYCEMGIDVRWYAQRGQNIVRSSCVGCGICSAVCPRGVLKLENGPESGRINDNPILIGKEGVQLSQNVIGE